MRIKDCIFCQQANRQFIIENERAGMIMDINPVTKGHALIITKQHYDTLFDVPDADMNDMIHLLKKAKNYLDNHYQPDGYNVASNVGPVGGQRISHCHIHLIPRYKDGDGSGLPVQNNLPHSIS
ncbi:HIT family protein [Paucilactobacillus suebicus]|nr:HIT family protein [Paucilactobacillus suebicus]